MMNPYVCLNDARSSSEPNPPRRSTIAARGLKGNSGGIQTVARVVGAQRPIGVRDSD
jgi:hypothetical protein